MLNSKEEVKLAVAYNPIDPSTKINGNLNISVNRGRIFFDGQLTTNGVAANLSASFDNMEDAFKWLGNELDVH